MASSDIVIRGAREHNLRDVALDLPRGQLICFTGVSGSGKSSLAFDTLYAEGQRRYVESLSSYARQFLGQMPKPQVDRIERVFDQESTADRKEDLTDRVIVSTALVYDGTELSKRFSEERDWLTSTLPAPPSPLAATFVQALADQAEYFDVVVKPRRSPKNSTNLGLVTHLQQVGMPLDDADLAALCIYFVRDAQHAMAHSVLSLFYAKLLRAKGDPVALAGASAEFLAAAKAVAAFFTLWMGASQGRFPDSDYRKLFDQHGPNMSLKVSSVSSTVTCLRFKDTVPVNVDGTRML